jgi:hypothetical protein
MNILWRNQRHIGDTRYGDLCARIRIGQQTSADISILNEKLIYYQTHKNEFDDVLKLCARKKTVIKFNNEALDKLKKTSRIYNIKAEDVYASGANIGKIAAKKHIYADESNCGGITDKLEIGIGATSSNAT